MITHVSPVCYHQERDLLKLQAQLDAAAKYARSSPKDAGPASPGADKAGPAARDADGDRWIRKEAPAPRDSPGAGRGGREGGRGGPAGGGRSGDRDGGSRGGDRDRDQRSREGPGAPGTVRKW
jgi:hypothetical protein